MKEGIIYSPECERLTKDVDGWFLDNEARIVEIMEGFRTRWKEVVDEDSGSVLDRNRRSLSEMPLCASLVYVQTHCPLFGFSMVPTVRGWVKVNEILSGKGFLWSTNHSYFSNRDSGMVACLTFGQFVSIPGIHKGGRITYVESIAPDLVRTGRHGLAILRGNKKIILDKLGLEFTRRKMV